MSDTRAEGAVVVPSFAVIIPVFNRADALRRCVASAWRVAPRSFEVIVVDDGSTEDMSAIFDDLRAQGVIVESHSATRGPAAARNLGARLATKDWLIFLDSDDQMAPNALQSFSLAAQPSCGLLRARYAEQSDVDARGREGFLAGTFAVRRDLFERAGGYDEELRFSENSELFTRLEDALAKARLRQVDVPVVTVVVHSVGGSRNYDEDRMRAAIRILGKHQPSTAAERAILQSIAAVNAARTDHWSEARRYARLCVQSEPRNPRHYVRLAIMLAGRAGRPYWNRSSGRAPI